MNVRLVRCQTICQTDFFFYFLQESIVPSVSVLLCNLLLSTEVYEGEYMGQQVAVKNIKCDVTAQAFLSETAVMT